MKRIAIVDKIGLCYDGTTLTKRGLGGSESAVILMAKNLQTLGFSVTVINNCNDSQSKEGMYDGVLYVDISNKQYLDQQQFDVVIVSRTAIPFIDPYYSFIPKAQLKILWLHDTFIEGDHLVESLLVNNTIDYIFTLSDFHTNYILNCDHGRKRNFEVLKSKVFQTRNGAVQYMDKVDLSKKDPNHFVYNASATKGMVPLLKDIWPRVKQHIPNARLTVIGGYYRFRDGAAPDQQEQTVTQLTEDQFLKQLDVTFTGVIPQFEIANILANATFTIYPGAFPETFGISSLESLLYNTPLITTRFGALEETALDKACYLIDYAIEPNNLFPDIDKQSQVDKFVSLVIEAYNNKYLTQQKQNYCDVVKDIAGWDTVALQWKQFIYSKLKLFLPIEQYRKVEYINNKIQRVFNRSLNFPSNNKFYSYGPERKIVVISPFWNAESYISNCIQSVASQDYDNYLHILIDDASTDNSFEIAKQTITSLSCKEKFILLKNQNNRGAIFNQLQHGSSYVKSNDIVILLDGDDWLRDNPTIFKYYDNLYKQGYEFTYGSMWSLCDNIPLISQDYDQHIKDSKQYRDQLFNWKIPYTHLRTVLGKHFLDVDEDHFIVDGKWMKSGADNPLFYQLIEKVDSNKIYCNKEIVCVYNDANPLNDYKINPIEQNQNASLSYGDKSLQKKILVGIPTNKYIEPETFKSIFDLEVPDGYQLDFQYFYGYCIDQVRNLIGEWARQYDYLLSVDSDIVVPKDALVKMLNADKDIISGLYIQRKPNTHILEIYRDDFGPTVNIDYNDIKNKGIVEIAACGMGICLIKSSVFRGLPYPHFVYQSALDHANTVSEDVYFCSQARKAGFKVWADSSIKCKHVGSTAFEVETDLEQYIESVYQADLLPKEQVDALYDLPSDINNIYDIGSCVLHWTRHAKNRWPNANIYLFEANPLVEAIYKRHSHPYFIGVLSDKQSEKKDFYLNPYNLGGNSYFKENTTQFDNSHITTAWTHTVKDVVEANNWNKPDLIKIDVQGAEYDVIKGCGNLLSNCRYIIVEAQHKEYNLGAPKYEQVKKLLLSYGFKEEKVIHKTDVDADYLFVNSNI